MKRWIAALVALLAVVSLIACTPAEPAAEPTEAPAEATAEPTEEPAAEPTEAPAEPTEEPAPELPAVSVSELFEALGMVEAEAYDFVCADGYVHNIIAEDIPACTIEHVDGRVDARVPGVGDNTLRSIAYIIPEGLTAETIDPEGGVQRIIVFEGVVEEYGLAASEQPRGDETAADCYSFAEFADAALWTTPLEEVQIVATDGYESAHLYMDIAEKYGSFGHSAAPTFAGETADVNVEPWHMAYINLGAEAVVFADYGA